MPITNPGISLSNKYVTTAQADDLTNQVVIPGLAASADIAGAGGDGSAYEFDSGSSPLSWDVAPAVEDVNTTTKSHLHLAETSYNGEKIGTYAWSPAGAFDIRMKLSLGQIDDNGVGHTTFYGLIVANSDKSNRTIVGVQRNGSGQVFNVQMLTYATGTYTQRGSNWGGLHTVYYVRIVRDGSNNMSGYYSTDGINWSFISTVAFTYTQALAGVRRNSGAAVSSSADIDWIRSNV